LDEGLLFEIACRELGKVFLELDNASIHVQWIEWMKQGGERA